MTKHYVKYLIIVLAFLSLTLVSYLIVDDYNSRVVSLSPSGGAGPVANTLSGFYVNSAPTLSGIFIVAAVTLMVLIVVESKTRY